MRVSYGPIVEAASGTLGGLVFMGRGTEGVVRRRGRQGGGNREALREEQRLLATGEAVRAFDLTQGHLLLHWLNQYDRQVGLMLQEWISQWQRQGRGTLAEGGWHPWIDGTEGGTGVSELTVTDGYPGLSNIAVTRNDGEPPEGSFYWHSLFEVLMDQDYRKVVGDGYGYRFPLPRPAAGGSTSRNGYLAQGRHIGWFWSFFLYPEGDPRKPKVAVGDVGSLVFDIGE